MPALLLSKLRYPREMVPCVRILKRSFNPVPSVYQVFIEVGKDVSDKIEAVMDLLQGDKRGQ